MKIKLDRPLFLVGVGLLVIGVGNSILVIAVTTIGFLLNLFGWNAAGQRTIEEPPTRT